MDYREAITAYRTNNPQEEQDKKVILSFMARMGDQVLYRESDIAHITSSGFVMNRTLDKVLLVHHNIRNVWSWTGGHADGDSDLLQVAIKEAREETGVGRIEPLTERIASVDILNVFGHVRKSVYVNAHLHLSIAYILLADETEQVSICPGENSGVAWFPVEKFTREYFDDGDVYLYNKLIAFARSI